MKKIFTLFALVFGASSAQSQTLEELFGAKEIVVCGFDYFQFDLSGFGLHAQSTDIVGISALKINLATGKVVNEFNAKVKAGVFLANAHSLLQLGNQNFKFLVDRIIKDNDLTSEQSLLSSLNELKSFADNLPIFTYNSNDFKVMQDVLSKVTNNVETKSPFSVPFKEGKKLLVEWGTEVSTKNLDQLHELLGKNMDVISQELGMNNGDNDADKKEVENNALSFRDKVINFAYYLLSSARKMIL
jgi:hypothetical protein